MADEPPSDLLTPEKLRELANALEVENDGERFKSHTLSDLIKLDRYLKSLKANVGGNTRNTGLHFNILSPPGSTGST